MSNEHIFDKSFSLCVQNNWWNCNWSYLFKIYLVKYSSADNATLSLNIILCILSFEYLTFGSRLISVNTPWCGVVSLNHFENKPLLTFAFASVVTKSSKYPKPPNCTKFCHGIYKPLLVGILSFPKTFCQIFLLYSESNANGSIPAALRQCWIKGLAKNLQLI